MGIDDCIQLQPNLQMTTMIVTHLDCGLDGRHGRLEARLRLLVYFLFYIQICINTKKMTIPAYLEKIHWQEGIINANMWYLSTYSDMPCNFGTVIVPITYK